MKKTYFLIVFMFISFLVKSQVGINTNTPNENSLMHVSEINTSSSKLFKGVIIPRYTTQERDDNFALTDNDQSLTIFNTDTECYNFWSSLDNKWISICGDKTAKIDRVNCNSITVNGVYRSDLSVSEQRNVSIVVPVYVVERGIYNYSVIINGITFGASGFLEHVGSQIIVLSPIKGTPTNPSGSFSNILNIDGVSSCNLTVSFLDRLNSKLKIINISGTNTSSGVGLVTGCNTGNATAGRKVGDWLTGVTNTPAGVANGTIQTALSIAKVNQINVVCVSPTDAVALEDELKTASVIYLNGRTTSQYNNATGALVKKWVDEKRGILISQSDEESSPYINKIGYETQSGAVMDTRILSNVLPEVFISPINYTIPYATPEVILKQGAAADYVIPTKEGSLVIGVGATNANRRFIVARIDSSSGEFILGDKFLENTDVNAIKFGINLMAWAISNAPVYE